MHRVVTDIRNHRGQRILEPGPWLATQSEADNWAELLQGLGYKTKVERLHGEISGGSPAGGQADTSLSDALASMA